MSEKLASTIQDIAKGIAAGSFRSEAEISNGVVRRILDELDWPMFKTRVVTPEFKIGTNKWVDYALCDPPDKAVILIEIKGLGKMDVKGEDQLFGYCGKVGVPLAVLTDGHIWSFYYIYGRGDYEERLFAQINLLDDAPGKAAETLAYYLTMEDVKSGAVRKRAEQDWERVWDEKKAFSKFAPVWRRILSESEPLLLDLFLEEIEKETKVKPNLEQAEAFIRNQVKSIAEAPTTPPKKSPRARKQRPTQPSTPPAAHTKPHPTQQTPFPPPIHAPKQHSFTFQGRTKEFKKAVDLFENVFHTFASMDPDFCKRYSERYYGKKLKYVARTKEELYPTDPHLRRAARHLPGGWWLGTNVSNRGKIDRIKQACHVMGLKFGQDLVVEM